MEEQERAEYERFGAVLSDRASQALTIKVEIEMVVEKERKEKEKIKKSKQIAEEKAITAMIKNTDLTDDKIANALGVEVDKVRSIRKKMNERSRRVNVQRHSSK